MAETDHRAAPDTVIIEKHITINHEDAHPVTLLSEASGLSRQRIKQTMNKGAVWLSRGKKTRHLRRASKQLRSGDTLHLYYNEDVLARVPPEPTLISDEGDYSIWFKPFGMLSQGTRWGDHCTITRWAEQHLTPQRPAFSIHRLDRAASGLIIVGHSKQATAALSQLFHDRKIDKQYRVAVHGKFPDNESPMTIDSDIDGRNAISHIELNAYDEDSNRSYLNVTIETGRKHQIRRHLAELGHPVIGDRMYGTGKDEEDLQLTAWYLGFICPVKKQVMVFRLPDAGK